MGNSNVGFTTDALIHYKITISIDQKLQFFVWFFVHTALIHATLDITLVIPSPFAAYDQATELKCVGDEKYFSEVNPFAVDKNIGIGQELIGVESLDR